MSRRSAWIIVVMALIWIVVNCILIYGFCPLDFYGDGAWFAQATLRFLEYGWPSLPISGIPVLYEGGWGPLTPWIHISLLVASFKFFGPQLSAMLYISLLAGGATLLLAGFLLAKLGEKRPSSMFFYLVLLLSPVILVKAHTPRSEALVMFWFMLCTTLVLSGRSWPRLLGFFLMAWGFWIHTLTIAFPIFTLLSLVYYGIRRKAYIGEMFATLAGLVFVLGASIIAAWMGGTLGVLMPVVIAYGPTSMGPHMVGVSLHILIPFVLFVGFSCFWAVDRSGLGKKHPLLKPLLVGIMFLPMLLTMRPYRIYQFVFPLILVAAYPVYLYLYSRLRLLGLGLWIILLVFMAWEWWKSRILFYTVENYIYIAKAGEFMERNRDFLASSDTVLMRLKGESPLFWFLPYRLKLTAARYPGDAPPGPKTILFLPADHPPDLPDYILVDSLPLGFRYSSYGAFGFRTVYLLRGR